MEQVLSNCLHVYALCHPGVCSDLVQRRALVGIVREQGQNQVLKLGTHVLAVDFLEVKVGLAGTEQVVEVLFSASLLEREDALDYDEKNDSEREQIDLGPFVDLSFFYLWSHVSHGSAVAFQAIYVLVAGEPEVSDFQVQVLIDEDVFQLKVSVDYTV